MAKGKRRIGWKGRLAALLLLVLIGAGGWQWWEFVHWAPSRKAWPVQGVVVSEADGRVNFHGLRAVGADFAYLAASRGADGRDQGFARNLDRARASGLQYGVVHHYDPCQRAEKQAANFVTIVPRDAALLPPAIELDEDASGCDQTISDAEVESELTTFLNQVEGHVGKHAILKVSPGFQDHYRIASRLERELWLEQDRFQPDYGGRPWLLWTANRWYRTEAQPGGIRWVVLQQ
jgi:lysozyme